jgi:hypothetical protein
LKNFPLIDLNLNTDIEQEISGLMYGSK